MNIDDILSHEPKLFPTSTDWTSFCELSNQRGNIIKSWYTNGTNILRALLENELPENWSWRSCGAPHEDTGIYLTDHGRESIMVRFGWQYGIALRSESYRESQDTAKKLINSEDYCFVQKLFPTAHEFFSKDALIFQRRHFIFEGNAISDEHLLAWYAGNRSKDFAEQALEQLLKFTKNPDFTNFLHELNRQTGMSLGSTASEV